MLVPGWSLNVERTRMMTLVHPAQLDGARLHDLGALVGQLEHLLVADDGDELGIRDDARVGGEDALHVGVDLAGVGPEAGRQRHRGRVRAAPPQRRHLAGGEGTRPSNPGSRPR